VFGLLRKRGVLFLGLSNTVSQLGDRLTYMAIITLIGIIAPGRISAFSEFSATFTLPIIILSPFVGVVIDHGNKQRIMFHCHLIQSALIFITPTFILLTRSMVPIWILVVLFYSLEVFNNTSRASVVPDIVDYDRLVPANSIINTLSRVATFIGMVGGGILIATVGWRYGFYLNATTHLIAGTLVLGMGARILFEPVRRLEFSLVKELRKSFKLFIADLKELGILLCKDRMVIFVMLSVLVLPFVAAVAHTVLVFLVQQQFGFGTAGVGIFGGVIGIGMLIGAVIMGYFGRRVCRGKIIIWSIGGLVLLFVIGPSFLTIFLLYLVAFISGVIFSFIGIAQDTILQEDVLKGIRGRIFATKEFILNSTLLLSAIIVGITSHFVTPYAIIRAAGISLFVVLVCAIIIYRSIPYEIRSKL
jgi:hypothetical protein